MKSYSQKVKIIGFIILQSYPDCHSRWIDNYYITKYRRFLEETKTNLLPHDYETSRYYNI